MPQIDEIFERATLAKLREFLLYGREEEIPKTESYDDQLEKIYDICNNLAETYTEEGENSQLYFALHDIITQVQHIYMELGLKAGIQLAEELLREKKADNSLLELHNSLKRLRAFNNDSTCTP